MISITKLVAIFTLKDQDEESKGNSYRTRMLPFVITPI